MPTSFTNSRGAREHVGIVVIVAEHEATLDGDSQRVQVFDQRAIQRRVVEFLADVAERRGTHVSKPISRPAQPLRAIVHELVIAADQAGGRPNQWIFSGTSAVNSSRA